MGDGHFSALFPKDLSEVRKKINPKAYRHSSAQILFWCGFDFVFYLATLFAVFVIANPFAKLFFGFCAGIAASGLFVLAHDAAHGALLRNRKTAEVLGTVFMLPALNVYRLWCFGHNRIHHGFTSFSPIDWIWRPLSVEEYANLSSLKRIFYRIERSLYGCGLHYFAKVWWPKMVLFMPGKLKPRDKNLIRLGKAVVVLFAVSLGGLAYYCGGIMTLVAALILPFIVFNYVISLIVYLHHTHPNLPFFDEKAQWNHTIGALYCTSIIHSHWLIDVLTHNIMVHTPPHIDIRIPFYRLNLALKGIKEHYGHYLHEYSLNGAGLSTIFKKCKLYNYKTREWLLFPVKN